MKTASKFFGSIAGISLLCLSVAVSTAYADHDQGGDPGGGGNDGDEHLFEIELSMMPTADAPAGSSARISFEAENEDGSTQAELKVRADGLAAGTYSVNAVLKSDGSTVVLGSFTVDNEGEGELELGHDGTPFPAIDPLNIASVNITAVNGVVLFTVDLSNLTMASSMNINVTVKAIAGAGNPSATGNVSITGFLSRGRVKGSLQFSGHGLPTNIQAVITVNGMAVKNVHTNKTGNLNVKLSPQGKTGTVTSGVTLAGITSVALVDRNGNVLLQANL
jgi:hypothetical protein